MTTSAALEALRAGFGVPSNRDLMAYLNEHLNARSAEHFVEARFVQGGSLQITVGRQGVNVVRQIPPDAIAMDSIYFNVERAGNQVRKAIIKQQVEQSKDIQFSNLERI